MPKTLVGVADIKYAARIPLHANGIVYYVPDHARTGLSAAVIDLSNSPYVILRFSESRNSRTARHRARPSVVGRQAQLDVSAIAFQQALQVTNPGVHVLLRVKRVGHMQRPRRAWHELHQPHSPFARNGVGVEVR